ncbi:MAG: 16S rRNA (uracil(1498)-N(3))-methyltransferase [Bacteroidetes bacterium]|nr:16S rRNA (uracil(1498)-N(3))-methyltransferase [Bacteroidota bacterium]MCH8523731.1 16S rRNA (uracil(1498)-N(3))-methyltransferase [Balneolales bacterium]
MQLFYDAGINEVQSELEIKDQEARHIAKVLRHQPGDIIYVTNGLGLLFRAELVLVTSKRIHLKVLDKTNTDAPFYRNLTLAVGLLKNKDRMEWLTEKATELGVGSLVWIQTNRTERGKIRLDRIESVMISAMKQSLQTWLPTTRVATLQDIIEEATTNHSEILLAHETEDNVFTPEMSQNLDKATLLIGPEGGFTVDEVENVVNSGGKSVLLGTNRLRSETAALTLLQYYHLSKLPHNSSGNSLRNVLSG